MSVREQHPSVLRRLPPTFQVRAPATGGRLREVLTIGQSAANTLSFGTRAARPARPVSTFRPAAGTGTTPGGNGEGSGNGEDFNFEDYSPEDFRPFRQGALDPPHSLQQRHPDPRVRDLTNLMGNSEVTDDVRPPFVTRQGPYGRPRAPLPGGRASLPGRSPPRGSSRRRSRSRSRSPSPDSDEEQEASELAAMRRRAPNPSWALDRLARGRPASMPPGLENANPSVQRGRGSPSGIENDRMLPNAGPAAEPPPNRRMSQDWGSMDPAVQPPSNAGPSGTVHDDYGDRGMAYYPPDEDGYGDPGIRYYPRDEDEWP